MGRSDPILSQPSIEEPRAQSVTAFRLPVDSVPALPLVLWYMVGSLGVLGPFFWGMSGLGATILVAVALGLLFGTCGCRRRYVAFLFLGSAVSALHLWAPWDTYRQHLPRAECGASIRAVVVSPSYSGDHLEWLAAGRAALVRLAAVRLTPESPWERCRGKVLLQWAGVSRLRYGSVVESQGAFVLPGSAETPGAFDYRQHVRCDGVRHLFAARHLRFEGPARGWRAVLALLFDGRDQCAERLVRDVDHPRARKMLTAMTLGYRGALDTRTRVRFVRSGAIHLFAISGLHVGILASLLILLLRALNVPFRARHLLLPPLLGLYVVMSGSAASAVRAWVMVSVWACARGLLRPVVPINVLSAAALLLLLTNPLNMARTGFQFSFVIVLVLVLGWRSASDLIAAAGERDAWVPPRLRPRHTRRRLVRLGLQLLGGSGLAWWGSAGLVAWTNSLVVPAAFAVNVGLSLLAWLTLSLSGAKLLLSFVPWLGGWTSLLAGRTLTALLAVIQWLTEVGSRPPGSLGIPQPPLWVVMLYYVGLLVLLSPGLARPVRKGAAVAVLVLFTAMVAPWRGHARSVTVIHGGASPAPSVIVTGASIPPIVVGTGGATAAYAAVDWLTRNGHDRIEALVLPADDWPSAGGAGTILDTFAVGALIVPRNVEYDGPLFRQLNARLAGGGRLRHFGSGDDGRSDASAVRGSGYRVECVKKGGVKNVSLRLSGSGGPVRVLIESDRLRGGRVAVLRGMDVSSARRAPISLRVRHFTIPL